MSASILPANATALERQIEAIGAHALASVDSQTDDFFNANTVPVDFLPLLAWAFGVQYWNTAWPENIKRQVVSAAPELNRIKGTKGAVVQALKALNIKAVYTEWHQNGGERGTFELSAMLSENITGGTSFLGGDQLLELQRVVNSVKRGSMHYTLNVGFDYSSPLSAPAAMSAPRAVFDQPLKGAEFPKFNSQTKAAPAAAMSRPVVQFDFIVTEHAA